MNHWLDSRRRKDAQDKMSAFGWLRPVAGGVYADVLVDEDPLFVPIPKDVSRLVRSYWIYVYLSGLMRYHL